MTQFPKGTEWYFFTVPVPYSGMLRPSIHTPAVSIEAAKKAIANHYPDDKNLSDRLIFEGTVPLSQCSLTLVEGGMDVVGRVPFP
jgi:hypothetical protein